ncbi:MAG: DUF2752 domain-containing protein [Paramuribaculum sp.]|nr:DUF2752 domain-containing protein [Paramuribaculum sp.]
MNQAQRRRLILTAAGLIVLAVVVIYLLLPVQSSWLPRCPIHWLTGYDCPGCGSQTALQQLLRGHIADAWSANPFLFIALPILLLTIYADHTSGRHPRLARYLLSRTAVAAWLIAILLWTLLRNL